MATITTIAAGDQITNSRTDINSNFANLNSDKIETSVIDTDTALAANSDAKLPSQKAVKAYVDTLGNVNASETARGIVEEATDAEVTSGSATGGTGAKLFVTPAKLATRLTGISVPIIRTYLNAASPATWTKPAGLKYAIVECQGAGGNGSNSSSGGGGGGGGAYEKKVIAAASLGTTETVTISAGGAGTGNTSFGSHVVTPNGGNASGATGGAAGSAESSDLNISGGAGQAGQVTSGGGGGGSFYGTAGQGGSASNGNTAATAGQAGMGYGAGGGGGGAADDGSPDGAGGGGTDGIVIVTEFYL